MNVRIATVGSVTPARNSELVKRFERGEVGESGFHHFDHVRAAYAYVCEMPLLEAIERFSGALRRFAAAQGKTGLYHETITWAYLVLIQERRLRMGDAGDWEQFANSNPDLLRWKDGILARYYKPSTLQSELARKAFLLPDGIDEPDFTG
jgi:hypothetical protein